MAVLNVFGLATLKFENKPQDFYPIRPAADTAGQCGRQPTPSPAWIGKRAPFATRKNLGPRHKCGTLKGLKIYPSLQFGVPCLQYLKPAVYRSAIGQTFGAKSSTQALRCFDENGAEAGLLQSETSCQSRSASADDDRSFVVLHVDGINPMAGKQKARFYPNRTPTAATPTILLR